MKRLKNSNGSFGVVDLNFDGTVIGATSAGHSDANSIDKTCVLVATGNTSASSNSLENLPANGWGFLITFVSGANGMQVFLSYTTNDLYIRRKSGGTFYDWKQATLTTVV